MERSHEQSLQAAATIQQLRVCSYTARVTPCPRVLPYMCIRHSSVTVLCPFLSLAVPSGLGLTECVCYLHYWHRRLRLSAHSNRRAFH
jgi:hypothetical protein